MKNSPKKTIPDEFKGGRCLKAIQKNRNLDIQEFMIMNFLASLCDLGEEATFEEERVFKRKFLAYECRMSLSSLERKSKKLSDKGYIILTENFKESGGQDSNSYRLTRKVFDEYLASLTGDPPRLEDDPPLVTVTTQYIMTPIIIFLRATIWIIPMIRKKAPLAETITRSSGKS